MNYAAHSLDAALASIISPQGKPASDRYQLEGYLTYLDAAEALVTHLEAGTITTSQRPAIDKREALWWITLKMEART